jgi:Zn-dependent peptidase ImmA (M78 family)
MTHKKFIVKFCFDRRVKNILGAFYFDRPHMIKIFLNQCNDLEQVLNTIFHEEIHFALFHISGYMTSIAFDNISEKIGF